MADSTWVPNTPRHVAMVRITHWITTLCFLALLLSGVELIISHPRFYWGEEGNHLMPALFQIPIPASRGAVKTGYAFVLPDQNGWSRYLHFQSAWVVVATGIFYAVFGLLSGHLGKNLFPRLQRPPQSDGYNVLQRITYLSVIFILFPLMIWTGLAMSPGVTSAIPAIVTVFGGQQSARTIHFFVTLSLVLFLLGHITMVYRAGFRRHMRAMITGHAGPHQEHS